MMPAINVLRIDRPKLAQADDWSGLSSAAERRRRQNRVNQRLHRVRKDKSQGKPDSESDDKRHQQASHLDDPLPIFGFHAGQDHVQQDIPGQALRQQPCHCPRHDALECVNTAPPAPAMIIPSIYLTMLEAWAPSQRKKALLMQRLADFQRSLALGAPVADHLLSLTRVNVYRGFIRNMETLGLNWDWMADDSISPFNVQLPFQRDHSELPINLQPTTLQRSRIHHTWIDFFPSKVMRDNLLKAPDPGDDTWDDEELCTDIMGYWEGNSTGPHSLVVWGEPSDPSNWEITEGFLRKWAWIVRGCDEVMRATNYWRSRRGEHPLFSL